MITVLSALGAGVGGVLLGRGLGRGYSIWRVSRQRTITARRVEPYVLPKTAQPGDVVVAMETRSGDASADYEVGRSPAHPTSEALDIWYADHDGLERKVRIFRVVGTGHPFPLLNWDHRGSYADVDLGLVWHLLELHA